MGGVLDPDRAREKDTARNRWDRLLRSAPRGPLRMELVGLMMVRNEADILRINVLHHLAQGIDRFLVVDNGSTDGTDRVLKELARRGGHRWTRDDGPYRQAEITTALAREAFHSGADWVVPIDADEFWHAPRGDFRRVLANSTAGALGIFGVNFIQRRDQRDTSPSGLLQMTRRPAEPIGTECAVDLAEARQIAFIELKYKPKWISRPTAGIEIAMGNHAVQGVDGRLADIETEEIICFQAPLRARTVLEARMVDHGRRAKELELPGEGVVAGAAMGETT